MSTTRMALPSTTVVSGLAALTTWLSLLAWRGLVESPGGYLLPAVTLCLLVALTGTGLRWAAVPRALVPLGQLAVLTVWVTHAWAPDAAIGGWVPTRASFADLASLVHEGVVSAQTFAAPVPDSAPAISSLLLVGAAGTAVLVDVLACGLRRVPLAGLPLLAVYTVPVSILAGGVTWWVFVLTATSFLATIAADESQRLAHWGRQISASGRFFDTAAMPVSTHAVRSAARRIGVTATGLAVVVPLFVPTLGTGLLGGSGTGVGGDGNGVSIANPIVDLKRDLVRGNDIDLLYLRTRDPDPSYLRISVLDAFDGKTWKPASRDIPTRQRTDGTVSHPPGLLPAVARKKYDYQVQVGAQFRSRWLPAPYPTSFIEAKGDWRYDTRTLDFISAADGQTTRNLDYQLRALEIHPTARQLTTAGSTPEQILSAGTDLPGQMPTSVQRQARRITAGKQSRFEMAVALQDWFRSEGGFRYSTKRAAGNGLDALKRFLGNGPGSRVGYCEQFAAAMALMGRIVGIPSRVAVGFLHPDKLDNRTYVYSAHDLHAWPEMYFQGVGWVRFEPTPSVRTGSAPGYTVGSIPNVRPSTPSASDLFNQDRSRLHHRQSADQPAAGTPNGGHRPTGSPLDWVLVVALVALLALLPGLTRAAVRRRRWSRASTAAARAEAAWRELRDSAVDLGLPWDDSVTLRTRARSLATAFTAPPTDAGITRPSTGPAADPEATRSLDRLVVRVERARYARHVTEETGDQAGDLRRCLDALRAGMSRGRRFRARWLPVSLVRGPRPGRRDRWRVAATGEPGVDHAT